MSAPFRETSRKNYTGGATLEEINVGSLQRIADATEKMASSYDKLRSECDYFKERRDYHQKRAEGLELQVRALKGVITKLRKKQVVSL